MQVVDGMGSTNYPPRRAGRRIILGAALGVIVAVAMLLRLTACPAPPPTTPAAAAGAASAAGDGIGATAVPAWADATHLIMVAGHAVLTAPSRAADDVRREASWYLEPFQRGQLQTMLAHIRRGVELAAADNASLLVFSGGETRPTAGPRSEALSYWEAADALGWFGAAGVRERSVLEVAARDSFENLLFAVCRFREAAGRYPQRVSVVSFGFKRRRFVELHRAALRFPRSRFAYVGVDPPNLGLDVLRGELSHSAKPFERDPYGCAQPELRAKRSGRNPFRRSVAAGYAQSCAALAPLLAHCEPSLYAGALPWSTRVGDDEDDGVPRASGLYRRLQR